MGRLLDSRFDKFQRSSTVLLLINDLLADPGNGRECREGSSAYICLISHTTNVSALELEESRR